MLREKRKIEKPLIDKQGYEYEVWRRPKVFLWVVICYLSLLVLFIGLRILAGAVHGLVPDWVMDVGFSVISQILIMAAIPLIVIFIFNKRTNKDNLAHTPSALSGSHPSTLEGSSFLLPSFGFNKPGWRVIGWAIALGFLCFFFNIFVSGFFNGILATTGFRFPQGGGGAFSTMGVTGFLITLLLVGVLPGIMEEISHRGMLMNGLAPKFGVAKAVLFSSIIFGLMHLNIVQMFYAAVLGYIIAWAVLATRSLWTGIIIHFINNGFGVYLSFAGDNGWFLGGLFDWIVGTNPLLFMAFLVIVYLLIRQIILFFAKENFDKKWKDSESYATWIQTSKRFGPWGQIKFYIDPVREKPTPLSITEKTVFGGILFLGTLVTVFTLVWGLL